MAATFDRTGPAELRVAEAAEKLVRQSALQVVERGRRVPSLVGDMTTISETLLTCLRDEDSNVVIGCLWLVRQNAAAIRRHAAPQTLSELRQRIRELTGSTRMNEISYAVWESDEAEAILVCEEARITLDVLASTGLVCR